MRKTIFFLVLCIFSTAAFGQSPELQEIEKHSHDKIFEYVDQFMEGDKNLEGVIDYALALQHVFDTNEAPLQKIAKLTYENENYWRAAMERTPRDSSVIYTSAYLYAAYGEIGYADAYLLVGSINVNEKIMKELDSFKELRDKLYQKLSSEISEGIKLHDEGQYEKAIEVYDNAIKKYPDCAMYYYEKGYSYMMESKAKNDPNLKEKAFESFNKCREKDPFFWRAYQSNDPNVADKMNVFLEKIVPFYTGQKRDIESFKTFAEGCEQVGLYPFAAHAQLKLSLIDPKNASEHVSRFFDLIEKSGCKEAFELREMFKLSMLTKMRQPAPKTGDKP